MHTTGKKNISVIYKDYRNALFRKIAAIDSQISLSADGWSTSTLKAMYMSCVVVHYIDNAWHLTSCMMECSDLAQRHTNDVIRSHWKRILDEWNLSKDNIACITVDGGSDYAAASRKFGSFSL